LGSKALNSLEIKMIEVLMKNYEKGGISSEQINDLLEINDKNVDNQRKLRNEFIKSLNLKLKIMHNFENSIERNPSSTDKRIFDYQLNEEIFKKLKNEFKDN
jgi:arsenate reductase-like glutaredoxin family protein